MKLYPLKVSDPDEVNAQGSSDVVTTNETRDSQPTVDETSVKLDIPIGQCVRRKAATKALENISEWTSMLSRTPGGCSE